MADSHREEIAKLEALYANNPEGRVFTHLAEAYRKAGELERAQTILQDGLTRHADYSSAHVVLGRVLMDTGETEGARGAFRRVLELDRHNLIALRALGDLAKDMGEREEALNFYRELLSLDPSDDRLRLAIAQLENEPSVPSAIESIAAPAPSGIEGVVEPAPSGIESTEEPAPEPIVESAAVAELESSEMIEQPTVAEAMPALNWEEEVAEEEEPLRGDLEVLAGAEWGETETDDGDILDLGWLPAETVPESQQEGEREQEAGELLGFEPGPFEAAPWTAQDEPGAIDWGEPVSEIEPVEVEALSALTPQPDAEPEPQPEPEPEREAELAGWTQAADWSAAPAQALDLPDERVDQPEELATETIAELYTAQGLHDRAAEVYRSLLRDRPEDAHLRDRLRESEAAGMAGGPSMAPAAPASERDVFDEVSEPEPEEGTSWLEGVESAWTGGSGVAGAGPTPYAWTDTAQSEEAGEGTRISEYFQGLLGWRPGAQAEASASEPEAYEADFLLVDEVVEEESVGSEEVAAAAADGERERRTDAADEDWVARVAEEAPSHELAAEPAEATDEDEDLEMFRSWLQSLKK